MKRILVAVDGSDGANAALAEAISLADALDASLTSVADVLTEQFASARAAVHEALAQAEAAGVDADYEILEGDPAEQIVRIATLRDVDLVVVGSRGLGGFAGALLGSVSRAVAQHADRPVLVVKQPAAVPAKQG
jgi:nucleotide-binding universal stress UspA family protein